MKLSKLILLNIFFYLILTFIFISKYEFNISCMIGLSKSLFSQYKDIIPKGTIVFEDTGAFDGQAYYMSALNLSAKKSAKIPFYFYIERPLFPLISTIITLGNEKLLPYAMPLLNLFAITISCIFVSLILKRFKLSPYLSLVYSFNPGFILGYLYNLTEVLCVSLLAVGFYFYTKKRYWYILFFCLGLFAKSSIAVLIIFICLFYTLITKDYKNLTGLIIALLPYLFYEGFFYLKLGKILFLQQMIIKDPTQQNTQLPFLGMINWFLNIEWQRKGLSLLYEFGIVPFIIFVIFAFVVSVFKFKKDLFSFLFLIQCFLNLCLGKSCWSTVGNGVRRYDRYILINFIKLFY